MGYFTMNKAKIGIIMGSISDRDIMSKAGDVLREFEIPYEVTIASAHRTPDRVHEYAITARERGIEIIIAGAGWAAHLAGVLASYTDLPVIAVPISSSPFHGLDALLASVQMPPGIPVAVMSVDGARNAGIFAAQILALKDPEMHRKMAEFRKRQTDSVLSKVETA
jgi:phosphoribosylaminoimidazole carboxylase PurE protein